MTKEQILEKLQITALRDEWAALCDEIYESYQQRIRELCNPGKLLELMETYGLFAEFRDEILEGAMEIRQNEALALFVCMLDKALACPDTYAGKETEFPFKNTPGYRFYPLIPMIHRLPEIVERYQVRNIPETLIQETLQEFEVCLEIFRMHNGFTGFDSRFYGWMLNAMRGNLLRIGRFNFEVKNWNHPVKGFEHRDGRLMALADGASIHKSGQLLGSRFCEDVEGAVDAAVEETETAYTGYPADEMGRYQLNPVSLSKEEWRLRLSPGDAVISVHIPRDGALNKEICDASYEEAWKIIRAAYPEYDFKAIVCNSWMLEKKLALYLKPTSNILAFQARFCPFATKAPGLAVFSFVYQFPNGTVRETIDYQALQPASSLQKIVKDIYLNGGAIYENGGFFFMD